MFGSLRHWGNLERRFGSPIAGALAGRIFSTMLAEPGTTFKEPGIAFGKPGTASGEPWNGVREPGTMRKPGMTL